MLHRVIYMGLLIVLAACSPKDHSGYVKKADRVFVSMIKILEEVEYPSDIYLIAKLNPYYQQIAELMVSSACLEEKNKTVFSVDILEAPHAACLNRELKRIYKMEGGKAACEAAARDGLAILKKHSFKTKQAH